MQQTLKVPRPLDPAPQSLIGLDLGQARDYTAVSVIERAYKPTGERTPDGEREKVKLEYRVRHLERPKLGTPYTDVVARVLELIHRLAERGVKRPALVVDATGCGRPVMDLLFRELRAGLEGTDIRVRPCGVTISGGDSVSKGADGGWRVPKRDLVNAALVLLQNEQLKIADALPLKDTLVKELLNFRVKINISTAHDSYEHWREGDHDDLVLSVAMACWAGERFLGKLRDVPAPFQPHWRPGG